MSHRLSALLWSQVLALSLLALLLYPQQGFVWSIVWTLLAATFIFVIPGYWLSYVFFDYNELSSFERFVMSIALSLAVIVFLAFYLHYFGIAVYPIHIIMMSCSIVALCWIVLVGKHMKRKPKENT